MKRQLTVVAAFLSILTFGHISLVGNTRESRLDYDLYKISSLARSSSVEIIFPKTSGSGVIVSKKGNTYTVLTAWHIFENLEEGKTFKIRTADHKFYQVKKESINQINNLDMAIFSLESYRNYETSNFSEIRNIQRSDLLFSSGFSSGTFHFKKGDVIANAQVNIKDGNQLIYSSRIIPGMSGGAIFDIKGHLVGINTMSNLKSFDDKNFSYSIGVPITHYLKYIKSNSLRSYDRLITFDDYLAKVTEINIDKGDPKLVVNILEKSLGLIDSEINTLSIWYAYKNLCGANSTLGNSIDAQRYCNKAIIINSKDISSYLNLAIAKSKLNDDYGAISDYNKILKVDGDNSILYYNRGVSKGRIRDYQGAILDYTKAIAINPKYLEAYSNRGTSKVNIEDYYGAISDYNKAIELNPSYFAAYTNRGVAKRQLGDDKGGCKDYKKAVSLGDTQTEKWLATEGGSWCRKM